MASPSRSRSAARERPSVPENAIAVHRMPATASPDARPSDRNANEKISTTMTAKNNMVEMISRVRHSTTRSFQSTSQACLSMSRIDLFQPGERGGPDLVGDHLAAPQDDRLPGQIAGGREIMGDQHQDAAVVPQLAEESAQRRHARAVEPGKGLVEKKQARL